MTVPAGLEVSDERLEAHGFTSADGVVLEGKVLDLATKQPIAAKMQLQRVEPQAKGGYRYPVVAETIADCARSLGLETGTGGMVSRGHRSGWVCTEGCQLCPV